MAPIKVPSSANIRERSMASLAVRDKSGPPYP